MVDMDDVVTEATATEATDAVDLVRESRSSVAASDVALSAASSSIRVMAVDAAEAAVDAAEAAVVVVDAVPAACALATDANGFAAGSPATSLATSTARRSTLEERLAVQPSSCFSPRSSSLSRPSPSRCASRLSCSPRASERNSSSPSLSSWEDSSELHLLGQDVRSAAAA